MSLGQAFLRGVLGHEAGGPLWLAALIKADDRSQTRQARQPSRHSVKRLRNHVRASSVASRTRLARRALGLSGGYRWERCSVRWAATMSAEDDAGLVLAIDIGTYLDAGASAR